MVTATTTLTASLVCCVAWITAGGQALMTLMTAVIINYRILSLEQCFNGTLHILTINLIMQYIIEPNVESLDVWHRVVVEEVRRIGSALTKRTVQVKGKPSGILFSIWQCCWQRAMQRFS